MKNLGNDCSRIFIKCTIFKLIHSWPQLFWIYSILGCRFLQGKDSAMFLCGFFVVLTSGICLLNEWIIEGRETCHWWKKSSFNNFCLLMRSKTVCRPRVFCIKSCFLFSSSLEIHGRWFQGSGFQILVSGPVTALMKFSPVLYKNDRN